MSLYQPHKFALGPSERFGPGRRFGPRPRLGPRSRAASPVQSKPFPGLVFAFPIGLVLWLAIAVTALKFS